MYMCESEYQEIKKNESVARYRIIKFWELRIAYGMDAMKYIVGCEKVCVRVSVYICTRVFVYRQTYWLEQNKMFSERRTHIPSMSSCVTFSMVKMKKKKKLEAKRMRNVEWLIMVNIWISLNIPRIYKYKMMYEPARFTEHLFSFSSLLNSYILYSFLIHFFLFNLSFRFFFSYFLLFWWISNFTSWMRPFIHKFKTVRTYTYLHVSVYV